MAPPKKTQQHINKRMHRARTNKLLDRLTYIPKRHKQKVRRQLRQNLKQKALPPDKPAPPSTSLKYGSFNINGLDLEASWAVEELLNKRGFDVSIHCLQI